MPQYLGASVPLAMQLQLTLEHEADWASSPEEDDEEATNFDFGVEALDRLAVALGGKKMHPVVSPLIMEYLQSADWKHRNAGLWSLSQVQDSRAWGGGGAVWGAGQPWPTHPSPPHWKDCKK